MSSALPAGSGVEEEVLGACRRAVAAQRLVAEAGAERRSAALLAVAGALDAATDRVLDANGVDLGRARFVGLPEAQLDRLSLDAERVAALAEGARAAARLPDPVGEVLDDEDDGPGGEGFGARRARRVRVPAGVVGVVHEGRPSDAVGAAVLGVRAGCAVLLRGSTAARQTGLVLADVVAEGLAGAGLPADAVQSLDAFGREGVGHLLRARGLLDLAVPLGGAAVGRRVLAEARVPVLEPDPAPARTVLDATADPELALAVAASSWSVLVHADLQASVLPRLLAALAAGGGVCGDERARAAAPPGVEVTPAGDEDGPPTSSTRVAVVDDLDAALDHLRAHPGAGVEAVVTGQSAAARRFALAAGAPVVLVNTPAADDGARSALALVDLTAARWVVRGARAPG